MRIIALLALASLAPAAVAAQEAADIMDGLRQGGGWVRVPIQAGAGSARTMTLPSVGMTLAGCLNVWGGHSGSWEIRARDNVSAAELVVEAQPGVGVPFSHTFGFQAQVDFDFRWSEARDTTLLMWVGLAVGRSVREACTPVFGDYD